MLEYSFGGREVSKESSRRDNRQLKTGARLRNQHGRSQERKSGAPPVRAQVAAHAPNGLGDDGDGKQFQSVNETLRRAAFSVSKAIGGKDHKESRW